MFDCTCPIADFDYLCPALGTEFDCLPWCDYLVDLNEAKV